jgi:hypothetical protein
MPQGRSCGSSVTVAPAASVLARSASTSAPDDVAETELAALRRPLRDPGVLGELAARVESANQAAVEPDMTMAPAGFVSSSAYSVAVTPCDSRPSPSRSKASARSRSLTASVISSPESRMRRGIGGPRSHRPEG